MPAKSRPCKRCGADIPSERVEAVRGTMFCARCSEEVGGEWEYTATAENIAKAGSLKKNYGGFAIQKRRKAMDKDHPQP